MGRDMALDLLKNPWWGIVALAFGLGASIAGKLDKDTDQDAALATMQVQVDSAASAADILRLTQAVDRLDSRLRLYICNGKPVYCQ